LQSSNETVEGSRRIASLQWIIWISFLAMGILFYSFVTEVNIAVTVMPNSLDWLWFYSTVIYFFLSVLTISAAALFTSGIERATIYKTAIGSFIITMAFFLFVLMLELIARPIIFW
jgi:hypothetical protein